MEFVFHPRPREVQNQPVATGSFRKSTAGYHALYPVTPLKYLRWVCQAEETKQTTDKVFEDRYLTLDAQIVRIMKGKKQLRLQDLINEVIEAVQKLFQPEVKAIKAQVESLIEREYLERDDGDRNILRYLA